MLVIEDVVHKQGYNVYTRGQGNIPNTSYSYTRYFIKKMDSDEILQILDKKTSPTFPKKYIEKVNQWFQDYPALAEAIISGELTDEWAIANLYNIHDTLQKPK